MLLAFFCFSKNKHIKPFIYTVHVRQNRFRYSFICQGTSTRRQRSNLISLRVKLPPVTTCLTTRR